MSEPKTYPLNSILDFLAIPEEALPRLLAEMPTFLQKLRDYYGAMGLDPAAIKTEDGLNILLNAIRRHGFGMKWIDDPTKDGEVIVRTNGKIVATL